MFYFSDSRHKTLVRWWKYCQEKQKVGAIDVFDRITITYGMLRSQMGLMFNRNTDKHTEQAEIIFISTAANHIVGTMQLEMRQWWMWVENTRRWDYKTVRKAQFETFRVPQHGKVTCRPFVTKMCGSSVGTVINITENEALEALTSEEEKYPAGIQPLPLPKPAWLAALPDDEGYKVKAQIWHIQQTSQHLPACSRTGQRDNATFIPVVHTNAWNTLTKQRQTVYS